MISIAYIGPLSQSTDFTRVVLLSVTAAPGIYEAAGLLKIMMQVLDVTICWYVD